MTKIDTKSKKGFTIIEVVLVLAIAGLIFLMVFVALPNLQRTQRDTQRRNDLDRLSTSLTQYITNNNKLPAGAVNTSISIETMSSNTDAWGKFAKNYLLASGEDTFEDPNGASYGFRVYDGGATAGNPLANQVQELSEPFNNRNNTDFNDLGIMVVAKQAKCSGDLESNAFEKTSGQRSFAVAMRLEGNGIYCVDNH